MLIHLHKQATTTPKVRAAIQASGDAGTALAERFGGAENQKTIQWIVFPTNAQTIYKWRNRDSAADRSHTPHRLQTTLTYPSGLTGTKESEFGFRCISRCAIEGDAHRNWVYRIAK